MASMTYTDGSANDFTLPALLPPPGVTSNFINPTSRGRDLVITSALCIPLMIVCVAVRFYTKIHVKHIWGWDDWVCIPATIGCVGFAATALSTLGQGVGPHQWNVPFTAFTPSLLRRFVVLDMLYSPSILMAKLSLLLLYLQIFRPNVILRYCIYISMIFLSLFYTSTFVAYAVLSIPKRGQSQLAAILSVNTAKDIPLGITQGAVNVASDFLIFCLPIPVVWKLNLPRKKKIGVLMIFMTGLLACISSAFGLYYRVTLDRNSDVTWKLVFVLLWVVVEMTVGVICGCLPSFAGFFRYHLPLLRSILSLFSSKFSQLFSSRHPSTPTQSGNSKRLATEDIKITLGSQVNGRGHFLTSTGVLTNDDDESPISRAVRSPPVNDTNDSNATQRHHYEAAANQHSPLQHPSSIHSDPPRANNKYSLPPDIENGITTQRTHQAQSGSAKPKRSRRISTWKLPWWSSTHAGYWDVMSIFRTDNVATSSCRKSRSESPSSDADV